MNKKEQYDKVRNVIQSIGTCESVRDINHDIYEYLMTIIRQHPTRADVYESVDLRIVPNYLNKKALEVQCILNTLEIVPISMKTCVFQYKVSQKTIFNLAMRYEIRDQVIDFRNMNPDECKICGITDGNFQVDHIIFFSDLVKSFLEQNTFPIPEKYSRTPWNSYCFEVSKESSDFIKSWKDFHKSHARYQILCGDCNRKRSNKK